MMLGKQVASSVIFEGSTSGLLGAFEADEGGMLHKTSHSSISCHQTYTDIASKSQVLPLRFTITLV
jgi:hypothetical protein